MTAGMENEQTRYATWKLIRDADESSCEEEKKKETILKAAAALFADKGYTGTAVREIVEAAGVTKPTLYYYFKNKEDLYIKLMDEATETFARILDDSLTEPTTVRMRLLGLYTRTHNLFQERIHLLRLANTFIYGPRGAAPRYDFKPINERLDRTLVEILQAGVEEGELRAETIKEVKLLLMGLLRSLQAILVLTPVGQTGPVLTLEDIRRAIDLIFDGARNTG